jgi:hypothetical protein
MPEFQQRLFVCKNCGRDTMKQPHAHQCPVFDREEAARQTVLKTRELGIGLTPNELFGTPLYDP